MVSKAPLGSWLRAALRVAFRLFKKYSLFPAVMTDEGEDKMFPVTLTNTASCPVFCITGDSHFSIPSTWHMWFSRPRGPCQHDQVRRKLQKWHPVTFHAGMECSFTMKSLFQSTKSGAFKKITSGTEYNFQIDVGSIPFGFQVSLTSVRNVHAQETQGLCFTLSHDKGHQDLASQSLIFLQIWGQQCAVRAVDRNSSLW